MCLKKFILVCLSSIIPLINSYSQKISIDGTEKSLSGFICGEQHSISLSPSNSWSIKCQNPYFIWQRSDNGGASWQNLPDRGEGVTSINVVNYDGTPQQYRVVIGESEDIANEYVLNGSSTGIYIVTNEVKMQCDPGICGDGGNRLVVWKEDFKSVPRGERRECDNLVNLKFAGKYNTSYGTNIGDGRYAVVSHSDDGSTAQYHWFSGGTDHTGNKDGGFLIINNIDNGPSDVLLYEKKIEFELCPDTWYYFSLYAMCITGGFIGKKYPNGAFCNFTFEIVGEDGTTVLASNKSGEVPLSDYGISSWYNYGVSFNSEDNKNVTLRIYDSAKKNLPGNDMALDDISLIACEKVTPEVSLGVGLETDKEGVCGETTQLELSDMSEWEKKLPDLYCTWQVSGDGGLTWSTLEESGEKVYSIEVPFKESEEGIRYRVIISKDKKTGAFIAENGYSNDPCSLYKISNISTLTCNCKMPDLTLTSDKPIFCEDEVKLTVQTKDNSKVDYFEWIQQDSKKWDIIETQAGNTITVKDKVERNYGVVAWKGDCSSDTAFITIKAKSASLLVAKVEYDSTVCENGTTTFKVLNPLSDNIIWTKKGESDTDFTIFATTTVPEITVSQKEKTIYCAESEVISDICIKSYTGYFTVDIEKPTTLALSASTGAVCANGEVDLSADFGTATSIAWEKKAEGETEFSEFATGLTTPVTVNPAQNTTYRIHSTGVCPNIYSEEVSVTAEDSLHISIAPIDTRICAGAVVDLKAITEGTPTAVVWEKTVEGSTTKLADEPTAEDIPTQTCDYTVTATGKLCPDATQSLTVTVDTEAQLALSASAQAVCVNSEVDLTADFGTATSIAWEKKAEGETEFSEFATGLTTPVTVNPAQSTTYRIHSTDNGVCPDTYSEEVSVTTEDSLHISIAPIDTRICAGAVVDLKAITEGTPTAVVWEKTVGGSTTQLSNSLNATDIPAQTCDYTVTATGKLCPDATKSLTVTVDTEAQLALSASAQAVCVNSEVDLTADFGTATSIAWEKKTEGENEFTEFANDLTSPVTVNPVQSTTYRIHSTDNGVCPDTYSEEISVTTEDSLHISITPIDTRICAGAVVDLKAITEGTPTAVVWEKTVGGNTTKLADEPTAEDIPTQTCDYTVTATGKLCPDATQSLTVTVDTEAQLALSASAQAVCVNSEVDLTADFGTATSIAWEKKTEGEADFSEFATGLTTPVTVNPAQSTTYRIHSTDNGVCPDTYSEEISVTTEDSLHISITPIDTRICAGAVVDLKAITEGTPTAVVWEKTVEGSTTKLADEPTAEDIPTQTCDYTVTATGKLCPDATQSLTVTVDTEAQLALSASAQAVCVNSEVALTADFGTATSIAWEKKAEGETEFTEFATGLTSPVTVNPVQSTTYRIHSTDNGVCPDTYSEEVFVLTEEPAAVELAGDNSICRGNDYPLNLHIKNGQTLASLVLSETSEGAIVSQKQIDMGSSSDYTGTLSYYLQKGTTFSLKATPHYCPEVEAVHSVRVDTVPAHYVFSASADTICKGDPVTLSTDFPYSANNLLLTSKTAGTAEEQYMGAPEEHLYPDATTTYTLTPRTTEGCPGEAQSLTIQVSEPITGTTADTTVCIGETARLSVTGGLKKEHYVWASTAAYADSIAIGNRHSVLPKETTTYYVQATNGKCVKEMEMTVNVAQRPSIVATQENAKTIIIEGVGGTGNYQYDLGLGYDLKNVIENALPKRKYKVSISDELGCVSDTTITAQYYQLIIPDFFTPQNDGINDTWKIINLDMYSKVKVNIFDRYGKQIYASTDPLQEWDGTYNGHALPSSDYWYTIYVFDTKDQYTGHFTLIRQ